MKKIVFLTALCLIALVGTANSFRKGGDRDYRYEQQKVVERTFQVSENPILEMSGKYSDFIITSWDERQIDFKVRIIVKGDDAKTVEAKFNSIDVNFECENNKVQASTVFGNFPYKVFTGTMTIKYYVKVPEDVFMELTAKYGDITVDKANKRFEANLKYGDLTADNLMDFSEIDVKYGDININNAQKIRLELDYGDAKINKCAELKGELDYSKLSVKELGKGSLNLRYSSAKIENACDVTFNRVAYSDVKLSQVTGQLDADMQYSDLKATVTSEQPSVEINSQYSDALLHLNESASFDYSLKSSYGEITFKGFFEDENIPSKGRYGTGEPGHLNISIQYGHAKILKNK